MTVYITIKGSDPLLDGITFTVALETCTPPRQVYMYTFLEVCVRYTPATLSSYYVLNLSVQPY